MSDSDNDTDSKRPARGRGTLRTGVSQTGSVKQSFSHGRTKQVVVEKRRGKKLSTVRDDAAGADAPKPVAPKPRTDRAPASRGNAAPKGRPANKGGLSEEEHSRRVKALEAAKKAAATAKAAKEAAERKKIEDAEAASRAAEAAAAEEAAAAKAAEEAAARAAEEEAAAAAKAAEDAVAQKVRRTSPTTSAAPAS